jgi:hypothetical protein
VARDFVARDMNRAASGSDSMPAHPERDDVASSTPTRATEGTPIGPGHFDAPCCRNCGASLVTRYCGECGQEKARRFNLRAVGNEAWQNWRWFELDVVKAAWRLLSRPGTVAREYVLGTRRKHVHPLKLLLIAIGVQLLLLGQINYLDSQRAGVSQAMELVRAWSNWSFSLTILAIVTSSWVLFRKRGFNLTEHLVLAVYAQFLLVCASIVSKLPALAWRTPEFLDAHKAWSMSFMNLAGIVIVTLALKQFFLLELRRDGLRLALAAAVFVGVRFALQSLYATLLIKLVLARSV